MKGGLGSTLGQVHVTYWARYFDRSTRKGVGWGICGGDLTKCWGGVACDGLTTYPGVVTIEGLVPAWYTTT